MQYLAPKEPSDFKEAMLLVDVWKSATTISGAQCVMTIGMLPMLKWSVDSWDLNPWVSTCTSVHVWSQCTMTIEILAADAQVIFTPWVYTQYSYTTFTLL